MIAKNLAAVKQRIEQACDKTGRDPSTVTIMGATKRMPVQVIREAICAGISVFGENRVQEAKEKAEAGAFEGAGLFLIGHLQTNKASWAARLFQGVHSVDSQKIALTLSRFSKIYRTPENPIQVMVEVNIGHDPAKFGVAPENALDLVNAVVGLPGLALVGLMTVPPLSPEPGVSKHAFRELRLLRERLIDSGIDPANLMELSMGMSADYPEAVEEGATLIRLGTVLFGPRPAKRR